MNFLKTFLPAFILAAAKHDSAHAASRCDNRAFADSF
jgi:hypothetical protein